MPKTCFVVMGFGKKTDYQTSRVLDLDKSYRNIIKPAAIAAGLDCKRADEIVHSGTIDVPMYEQLLSADVVVADVSTYNPNAFYELGVRHALRPYTTITIAEDKMVFPFDVSHLAVRKYHHLGEGIDSEEVDRMRNELTDAMRIIMDNPQSDSPIYTFFQDLDPPVRRKLRQAIAESAPAAFAAATPEAPKQTISAFMEQANAAMARSDFESAKTFLKAVRTMAPKDPYVIQRLALATYKTPSPDDPTKPLLEAVQILNELDPKTSTDTETLGMCGAICKRLWDVRHSPADLDAAIQSYQKGFYLKNDYYNGINLAFLYDVRASISSGPDAIADSVIAQRVRRRVLTLCDRLLTEPSSLSDEQKYWILATVTEAYVGLNDEAHAQEKLAEAKALNQPKWMIDSTETQISKLRDLLKSGPLAK